MAHRQSGDVHGTYNFKVNAGASAVVSRANAYAATTGEIKELSTNIALPSITAGTVALYLLPYRMLVRDGKRYSDIDYGARRVFHGQERFIEDSAPPGDATQVDYTWRYVNVGGGPDRLFSNNAVLPITRYGRLLLTSASGLYCMFQTSRSGGAQPVAWVLKAASRELRGKHDSA